MIQSYPSYADHQIISKSRLVPFIIQAKRERSCTCVRAPFTLVRLLPLRTYALCCVSSRDNRPPHISWSGDPSITSTAGRLGRTLADRMNSSIDWAARPHWLLATIMLSATRDGQEGARAKEGRGKNVQYVGGAPTTHAPIRGLNRLQGPGWRHTAVNDATERAQQRALVQCY